jgi:hypothetical protein
LEIFAKHLAPGGSILFDAHTLHAFSKKQEGSVFAKNLQDGFWSSNEYFGFLHQWRYEKEKVGLDKYDIFEEDQCYTVYNWIQYFSQKMIEKELTKAGFVVTKYFGNVAGAPFSEMNDDFAIVAMKK